MADSTPRIPSLDDIRWLFEQLQTDSRPAGEPNTPAPAPADEHEETSRE